MLKKRESGLSLFLIMILGIIFVLTSQGFSQSRHYARKGRYTFQPGDGIRVKMWQLVPQETGANPASRLSDDYTIDGDGFALFPIVGRIKVKGMTPERLIEVLNEKYSPYLREPVIYVIPLIRVLLKGAFIKPGAYRVKPNSSLWELIEYGEGPSDQCDLKKLSVERGGQIVISDLLNEFEKGYSINDIGIQSGDQVVAYEKGGINFRQVRDYLTFIMTSVIFYMRLKEM